MTNCHIVPGLAHSSLMSTRKFCNAGCKVVFDEDYCRVYYKCTLLLHGGRAEFSGMWKLPVDPAPESAQPARINLPYHRPRRTPSFANNLYTLPYTHQQLKYMHQTFFSHPHQTIIDAAHNNQLDTILFWENQIK